MGQASCQQPMYFNKNSFMDFDSEIETPEDDANYDAYMEQEAAVRKSERRYFEDYVNQEED